MKMTNPHIFKFAIFSAFLTVFHANSQEVTDTIKVINKANEIVVTRIGNTTKISADISDSINSDKCYIYEVEVIPTDNGIDRELPDSWEMNIPFITPRNPNDSFYSRKKLQREISGFRHIYWGWRFNYNDKQKIKNCFEIGIRNLIGVTWNHGRKTPSFSISGGFGMMRFLAQDGSAYEKKGDAITFIGVSNSTKVDMSRLDIWRFHVPIMMSIPLGKAGNFCLGGVLNFNTYASAITQTYNVELRDKIKFKGLQQNLLTPDLYASISIGGMGIYATWSPTPLFKKEFGPQLKSWSIGIDLMSF